MTQDKSKAERKGGEYMIQDRDHSAGGQMGGETEVAGQSEQSHDGGREQGGRAHEVHQQGGQRTRK